MQITSPLPWPFPFGLDVKDIVLGTLQDKSPGSFVSDDTHISKSFTAVHCWAGASSILRPAVGCLKAEALLFVSPSRFKYKGMRVFVRVSLRVMDVFNLTLFLRGKLTLF